MGRRIRLFEPHAVYSTVIRCVDRQFMLRPDHDTAHPLLAAGCPPEALDPTSPVVPVPSVVNVIGSATARYRPNGWLRFDANMSYDRSDQEWEDYRVQVSAWELDRYLPVL